MWFVLVTSVPLSYVALNTPPTGRATSTLHCEAIGPQPSETPWLAGFFENAPEWQATARIQTSARPTAQPSRR